MTYCTVPHPYSRGNVKGGVVYHFLSHIHNSCLDTSHTSSENIKAINDARIAYEAANFSLKNDCFGRVVLCCFAFLLCCCCLAFLSISSSDCSCTILGLEFGV